MEQETPLKTTEKYLLAEVLALGNISMERHENLTNFSRTVFIDRIGTLDDRGILEHTLYKYDNV
jgi:hypothetical protein